MNTMTVIVLILSISTVLSGTAIFSYLVNKKISKEAGGSWASQKTPLIVTIGTTFATAIGGGVLTYHIGLGYEFGWSALSYGVCQGGGVFCLIIIAKWLRSNEFVTIPDIFTNLYGESKFLLAMVAFAAILTPFGWIAGQCVAFGKLFSALTGIPIPVLTIIFAFISLCFVMPGGFGTVAWADAVFGFILCATCVVTVIFSLDMAGGWSNIVGSVPQEIITFPGGMMAVGGAQLALWFMSVLPGQLTNQMYIQRVSAVAHVKDVYKALGISCLMIFAADIFASCVGMSIRTIMPGLAAEEVFGWFLTQLPLWLMAMITGLIGAAIMSTCNSAVQSTTVSIVYDVYRNLINPGADEKKLRNLSRIVAAVVLTISVVLGLKFPNVLNLITTSYSYGVAVLLVPMYVGFLLRKKNFLTRQGCYCSMAAGLVGCLIFQALGTTIPFVMFGLIFSLVGLLAGSALTKKPQAA